MMIIIMIRRKPAVQCTAQQETVPGVEALLNNKQYNL